MTSSAGTTGVFTTDRDLVVVSWDEWLADASGIAASDARGRPIAELYPDLVDRGMIERLRRVAEGGGVEVLATAFHKYLLPLNTRNRSVFERMRQFVTIVGRGERGVPAGIVVTIEDVTERLDRDARLARELASPDESTRMGAVRSLGSGPDAAPLLAGSLGDTSWRVRREASDAIAKATDDTAVAMLIAAIRDAHDDLSTLNAALTALSNSAADVVGRVAVLLEDERPDVRTYAALALGLLEDERGVAPLLARLSDPDTNVRFHALEALGRIGDRSAADAIATVAETRDFSVAFVALDALAAIGEPSVASRLIPLLDDPMLIEPAANSVGALGSEEVVAPLMGLLSRSGTPATTVAVALERIYERLEEGYGDGALVGDLARAASTQAHADRLIAALRHANADEMHALIRVLGWLRGEGIDAALTPMLAHPVLGPHAAATLATRGVDAAPEIMAAGRDLSGNSRRLAAVALRQIGWDVTTPLLVTWLQDEPDTIVAAAGALGAIGDSRAFEPLLSIIGHPMATVRQAVVSALNSIGHPDMPAAIERLLSHDAPETRESAGRIAGYFGYQSSLPRLIDLTGDPSEMVRRMAVEALANFDTPEAWATIARVASGDSNPMVRAAAIRAARDASGDDVQAALQSALGDANMWVRYHGIRTVASRTAGSGRPSKDLIQRLSERAQSDMAPPVRIAAAEALALLGAERAVPLLIEMSADDEPDVAAAAMAALGSFRAPESLTTLVAGIERPVLQVRRAALGALGRLRTSSAAPAIARLAAGAPDEITRRAATNALGKIGTEGAVAELIDLLADRRLRVDASRALATVGPESIAALTRGLRHESAGVRCAVIDILSRVTRIDATRYVTASLGDEDSGVRLAAAEALTRRDVRDVQRAMALVARSDDNAAVRSAAATAMARE